MASRGDLLLALTQDLLHAPGSEDGWKAFLLHLCDALDGSGAHFISHELSSHEGLVAVTVRTPGEAIAAYEEHWARADPWAHAAGPRLTAGAVVSGDQLIERNRFERTAFCQEYGRPYDMCQCVVGVIEKSEGLISVISVNGDHRRERFADGDREVIRALMPSIRQALTTHRRLEGATLDTEGYRAVMDRLSHGVLLLSAAGRVLATNPAADRILAARDGLCLHRGELRASTGDLTHSLRMVLGTALARSASLAPTGDTAMALPRPSGKRPLWLHAASIPLRSALWGSGAAAAVFVTDPEQASAPSTEAISAICGVTPAEARLVQCLVLGLSVEQSAARLGVTVETARKRLKQVFSKSGTHRQADLVRLVLTSVGPVTSR